MFENDEDPEQLNDGESTDELDPTDSEVTETTQGTEGEDNQDAAPPKKWAGMYESPEVLESSFQHLQSAFTRNAQELAELKRQLAPAPPPPAVDPLLQGVAEFEEVYGETPVLKGILSKLNSVEAELQATKQVEALQQAASVNEFRVSLEKEQPTLYSNPDLGNAYLEAMNDRLATKYGPEMTFEVVTTAAANGRAIHPQLARDFKEYSDKTLKLMGLAAKAAPKTEKKKVVNVAAAADTLGASTSTTGGAQKTTAKPGSYKAALAAALQSDFD